MLQAYIPRNLRVRASVQIASQRVPAKGFILVAGVVFIGGMLVVFGTDLERVVWVVGIIVAIGLIVIEGRLWGRSSQEIARIVMRHYRRSRRLRRAPITLTLPPEAASTSVAARRPRWMEEGSS
ncbi:MAG TPA: hypothetical protein VNL77_13995 [Roseiflexaceae bacterium]|nr:hypothetical protein [Roseiflexaceae bacterium]